MWIFWALLSAIFAATRRPFEKNVISRLHFITYALAVQLAALPVIAAALLSGTQLSPLTLGPKFWIPAIVSNIIVYPFIIYLYTRALRTGELSKVLPLQSLLPVCSLLAAWLLLGEAPTLLAAAGIAMTVTAIYVLGLKGRLLHHPLQPFREDISSRFMLCNVGAVSLISMLDKTAIKASNPLTYSLISTVLATCMLSCIAYAHRRKTSALLAPYRKQLVAIGTLQGLSFTTVNIAVSIGPIAYVAALRSTNILLGSLLGIALFQEKMTRPKAASLVLIVAGSLLLALGA